MRQLLWIVISAFMILGFNGCTSDKRLFPELPVFEVPAKSKIKKGTSCKEAFRQAALTNIELRRVCSNYKQVAEAVNREYQ